MQSVKIRNIHGETFNLDDQGEATIRALLEEEGVLVICQRSNIAVPMNSLNLIQAREVRGDIGYTTFEFLKKDIFMSAVCRFVVQCVSIVCLLSSGCWEGALSSSRTLYDRDVETLDTRAPMEGFYSSPVRRVRCDAGRWAE